MSSYFVNSLAFSSQAGTQNAAADATVRDYSQTNSATGYRGYNHTLSAPAVYPPPFAAATSVDLDAATTLADNARDFYEMNVAAAATSRALSSYTDSDGAKRDDLTSSAAAAGSTLATMKAADAPSVTSTQQQQAPAGRMSPAQNLSQSGDASSTRNDSTFNDDTAPPPRADSPDSDKSSKSGDDVDSPDGADDVTKSPGSSANTPQIYPWMRRMHIGHGTYTSYVTEYLYGYCVCIIGGIIVGNIADIICG